MKRIFEGVCTALVTPFERGGGIDFEGLRRLVEFQIAGGTNAVLVLGTTGEASTVSFSEKRRIVEAVREQVEGRVPLIVGIGGNNPKAIIEFGKYLKKLGRIDGVLLSSPYYNKATQNGLVNFFSYIADKVRLPIIVYNVPARTGVNIEPATFERIVKNKYIAGIKEAGGSIQQMAEVIRACPNTAVYAGDDGISLPSYSLGAAGVISVASNVAPRAVGDIYRTAKTGDFIGAGRMFLEALPLYKALFCEVNPIPVKYALNCMGLTENELRLPLTPLEEKNREPVESAVNRCYLAENKNSRY